MIPVLFIILMLLIISCMNTPIALILLGLLFIPISFLFALSVDGYTRLFTADITAVYTYPQFKWMLQGIMFMIPGMAFFRLIYIKKGYDEAI